MSRTTINSDALAAVYGIADGATILVGGFGMAGMPTRLIDALGVDVLFASALGLQATLAGSTHPPYRQLSPGSQACPHWPQCCASLFTALQAPEHAI